MFLSSHCSWTVVKKILVLGDPLYSLVDSKGITHKFCNEQAIKILSDDGFYKEADLLQRHLEVINQGTCWADKGWKCLAHYLDPDTDKGLGPWPNAAQECRYYFAQALRLWKQDKKAAAFLYMGASLHLVQDLCVPHHANGVAFDGHQDFENWARINRFAFAIKSEGLYCLGKEPEQWVYHNARVAKQFYQPTGSRNAGNKNRYKNKGSKANEEFLRYAMGILLPLAQRTTAGFMHYFLTQLN